MVQNLLESLKGWRTYLVFGGTLILALAARLGWGPLTETEQGQVTQIVDFLTDPVFLSLIALALRKITTGPAKL